MEFAFSVPGNPVPKQRARRGKGGRWYTPKPTVAYEEMCGLVALKNRPAWWPLCAEYSVEVSFYFKDNRRRDLDNGQKAFFDGLNGVVWDDDSSIRRVTADKFVDKDNPRTEARIHIYQDGRTKHGFAKFPEYRVWMNMVDRCTNPNHAAYKNYGGRGIEVCCQWLDERTGFFQFLKDVGRRPAKMDLDRTDNDGGYTPTNVRWATRSENANNRRSNRRLTAPDGTIKTQSQIANEAGLSVALLRYRLDAGWSMERACGTPAGAGNTHGAKERARSARTTKLTMEKARQIRERALGGERYADIAADFGVCKQTVCNIKLNKTWVDV